MPDLSTIDLSSRPVAKLAHTYHVGPMGMGCFLGPPGYPSYFLRAVYTRHGNSPRKGTTEVITDADGVNRVIFTVDEWDTDKRDTRLRKLWVPLPIDHPRTRAWIAYVYGYMKNMYRNTEAPEGRQYYASDMIVKSAKNAELCTPENSAAVNLIRRYYPEHQPDMDLLDNGAGYGQGSDWWDGRGK